MRSGLKYTAMTEEQPSGNPFRPGTGFAPKYMAGREPEQALLKRALDAICGERDGRYGRLIDGAPRPLKIIGARGVGKTALLAWVKREVDPQKADVVRLADPPDGDSEKGLSIFLRKLADIPGFDWKQAEAQVSKYFHLARNWEPGQPPLKDFERVLQERLRLRPLMLLMDEAMHYDPKILKTILQQSQVLMNREWPLALVLAGTPALEAHLQKVDATFINRAKNIRINGLDPDATREALSKPFVDCGVAVSDEALELMVSWTDDYPYFTQIVGSTVWEAQKKAGCAEVDVALVRSVEQAVQKEREDFYESIYHIISKAKLLEHARKAVAAIEAAPKPLKPEQVEACLAEGTNLKGKDPSDIYEQLLDAGLFWEFKARRVSAAIPSFFNYFKAEYD